MTNTEIMDAVAQVTATATEIGVGEIKSKARGSEVVDARHIAIKVMHETGVYAPRIARYMGVTERGVHYALSAFGWRIRQNPMMRSNYEAVRNEVRKALEATP